MTVKACLRCIKLLRASTTDSTTRPPPVFPASPSSPLRFLQEALNLDTPKIAVMLSWQNFCDNIQSHLWDLGPKVMERVAQEAYEAGRIDKSVSNLAPLGKDITARIKQVRSQDYAALSPNP